MHSKTFHRMKKNWVLLRAQHFVEASCYHCQQNSRHDDPLSLHCMLWAIPHFAAILLQVSWYYWLLLLAGLIRRCNSGGRMRHVTGVSSSSSSHPVGGCITFPNFFTSFFHFETKKTLRITSLSWQWCVGCLSY